MLSTSSESSTDLNAQAIASGHTRLLKSRSDELPKNGIHCDLKIDPSNRFGRTIEPIRRIDLDDLIKEGPRWTFRHQKVENNTLEHLIIKLSYGY